MKKSIKLISILIGAFIVSSCTPHFYMPTKHNVLPFNEKGDKVVAVNAGFNDNYSLEGGYSITDHVGVTTSFNTMDITFKGNSKEVMNDFVWDNELVLYQNYKKQLYSGINLGAGLGKLNHYGTYYSYNFNRQYILPWVVYKTNSLLSKNLSIYAGFSAKFSRVDYRLNSKLDLSSDYDRQMFYSYFQLENFNRERFLSEIGFTCGLDFNLIKIQVQNQNVIFPSKQDYILPSNLTVSMYFYLNQFFRKK